MGEQDVADVAVGEQDVGDMVVRTGCG